MSLKKLVFVGCMSAGISFAGGMGQPLESPSWELGVEALYLKPALGNFAYIGFTNIGENYDGGQRIYRYFQPKNGWGLRLEGKYFFDVASDIKLNWSTFENTTKGAYQIDYDSNNDVPDDPVVTRQNVKWDDAQLEIEHTLTLDNTKHLRLHGGLEYAKLVSNGTIFTYDFGTPVTPNTSSAAATSTRLVNYDFTGMGPLFGIDALYDVTDCIQLYAKTSYAILLGNSKFNAKTTFTTNPNIVLRQSKLDDAVVPALMVDLGAGYFFNVDFGEIGINAGWRLHNYFNPFVNSADMNDDISAGAGIASNFSIQGAYVGIKWLA